MASRGNSDAIEINDDASDDEILECWTSDKAADAPKSTLQKPDGGIRQRAVLTAKDEAKDPNGRLSPSRIRKTGICSSIQVDKAPAASQDENRRVISQVPADQCSNRKMNSKGQANLLSWVGFSTCTTSSSSAVPTRQLNAAANGKLSRVEDKTSITANSSVPTSELSLCGDNSNNSSAVRTASAVSTIVCQGKSQEQYTLGASELATFSNKRKSADDTLSTEQNSDIVSSSDDGNSDADSSFCVIDDGPRPPTFGEQRSSIGSTIDDAISVGSSTFSDEECTRISSNNSRGTAPFSPYGSEYAALLLRRQERNRRFAIKRARNARSKGLKRKSSHVSALDASKALPVFETRMESDSGRVENQPNAGSKQSPVRTLRVVPSVGRSSRALHGTKADCRADSAENEKKDLSNQVEKGFGAGTILQSATTEDCNRKLPKPTVSLVVPEENDPLDISSSSYAASSSIQRASDETPSLSPGVDDLSRDESFKAAITELSSILETREIDVKPKPSSPLSCIDFSTIFQDDDTYQKQMCEMPDTDVIVDDNDNIELGAWAVCVTHLSRKSLHPTTQLPLWEFTVHGGDDSILYVFRTFVAPSKIAGGGNGAFIEFMEARRLNSIAFKRRQRLNEDLAFMDVETRHPLQAYPNEKGSGIAVKLTGQDLHSEGNRHYVPKRGLRQIRAKYKDKSVRVQVVGANIHDLPEFDAYFISETSPLNPVGYFGTQISCEYTKDNSIDRFKMDDNCIDLGRYGPFRKEDRLPEDAFILKSFIFSNEPQEWCYTVDEPLHDTLQFIDITSHDTGEPSPFAKAEIPMYVNEIGHSDQLKQNVWIRDSLDGRVVRYYFKGELQKGEPVELLTNYKAMYENVRERKGYGLRNIHEGLPSDDSLAERLRRGFDARDGVVDTIHRTESLGRLRYLLDFIETAIWQPIVYQADTVLRHSLSGHESSRLSPKQWAAVRRSYWIAGQFLEKIEQDKLTISDNSLFSFYELTIKERVRASEAMIGTSILPVLSLGCDVLGGEVFGSLEYENIEEICYGVRGKLLMVHNASIYCPISRALIDRLCRHLAPSHSFGVVDDKKTMESLVASFYERAFDAKQDILGCIERQDYSKLQFSSGVSMKSRLTATSDKLLSALRSSSAFFLQNSTVPKGIVAALIENLHYQELAELADASFFDARTGGCICDRVVMVRYDGITGDALGEVKALASIPIDISKVRASSQVNDSWYIQTQVVWIVDVLASHYLKGSSYTLSKLAAYLNVNNRHSEFVSTRGLDLVHASCFDPYLTSEAIREMKSDQPPKPTEINSSEAKEPTTGKMAPSASQSYISVQVQTSKSRGNRENLVYEGPPTVSLPSGISWPPDWIQRTYKRQGGASKGQTDDYFFPPPSGYPRLRSKVEVERYINTSHQDVLPFVPR